MGKKLTGISILFFAVIMLLAIQASVYADIYSSVSGFVFGEDTGKPLADIKVFIENEKGEILNQVRSNIKGQYIFTNLKAGRYKLGFTDADGKYVSTYPFLEINLIKGKNLVNVNYTMKRGSSISGKIIYGSAQVPVRSARVEAIVFNTASELRNFGGTFSDSNGHYRIDGLPASDKGVIKITLDGIPVQVAETKFVKGETTYLNYTIQIDEKTGVSGRITTKSGQLPEDAFGIIIKDSDGNEIAYGITDQAGNYLIKGLSPGLYNAIVVWPEPLPNPQNWLYKENIMVEVGRISIVDFVFDNR